MPLFDLFAFALGPAIAKAFVKLLLDDPRLALLAELAPAMLDMLRGRAEQAYAGRADERRLAAIGAHVAARMRPLLAEAALPDTERAALASELSQTLHEARIDAALLVGSNLDADLVARRLAAARPDAVRLLDPAAIALYERMLAEAASALILLADSLGGYAASRDRALLAAHDTILAQLAELLSTPSAAAVAFEEEYRRAVRSRVERLDLFGVPAVDDAADRQRLSVAYVTLQATRRQLSEPERDGEAALLDSLLGGLQCDNDYGPVDGLLANARRLLIRGDPGAGKTTLLQWLAGRAAGRQFAPPLAAWNNAVPFLLRLRDLEVNLRTPEQFPALLAPALAGSMPPGWVHEQLRLGRALVLIDGVDEVPSQRRADLLPSIKELVEHYPLARYIISSRPAAISKRDWPAWHSWAERAGFDELTIEPMTRGDIERYVDHWHGAYAEGCDKEQERANVLGLAPGLKRLFAERAPLRQLGSSPLLCAMICALHLEHRSQLPAERLQLYEEAVKMLLDRRDLGRGVTSIEDYPPLRLRQKLALITDFAYRMLRNGETSLPAAEVDDIFSSRLDQFDLPDWATGKGVRRFFVERASLLRDFDREHIAFTHRTFQEYLAARAVAEGRETDFLLQKVDDDQWRETIVLAAGLCQPDEAADLMRGLLAGGVRLHRNARRDEIARRSAKGQALALACLETCVALPRPLRQQVQSLAQNLFPPKSDDVARSIAVAGDLAVPYLAPIPNLDPQDAARCVDTLGYIGSDAALAVVERYAETAYGPVSAAIGRAWRRFNRQAFLERVLRRVPELALVDCSTEDLLALQAAPALLSLILTNPQLRDLRPLQALSGLQRLRLSGPNVVDLTPLHSLVNLEELALIQVQATNIEPLSKLRCLTRLQLSGIAVNDFTPLHALSALTELSLTDMRLSAIDLVRNLPLLQQLHLERTQVQNLTPLATLSELIELRLADTPVRELLALRRLSKLATLGIERTQVSDLAPLRGLPALTWLHMDLTPVGDLSPLADCPNLRHLSVTGSRVWNWGGLRGRPGVQIVDTSLAGIVGKLLFGQQDLVLEPVGGER
jgi:hypothetical protein